ncbi:hypothetical protein GCM10009836_66360 [Pseudonocardia ailaonensis]|uniref:Integral membrane protein n=1 Tax=Pseudonocardia ailaonensis TaxID=367279 RepID=A0ABN2NMG3_9PSEU
MTPDARPEDLPAPQGEGPPPRPVQVAAGIVGAEGLLSLVVAGVFAVASEGGVGARIGEASYFVIIGAALVFCAAALFRGRSGARTPAIVAQLLLVPVVYSTLSSGQLLIGIAALVVVVGTFLLLVSEPARRWSMGIDQRRRGD